MENPLVLTFAVLVTCCALGSGLCLMVTVRRGHRPEGVGPGRLDLMEAAFLIGGPLRAVDAALTALHQDGRIGVGAPGVVVVHSPRARDTVERAVLHACGNTGGGALHTLRLAAAHDPAVQEIGDSLAARGLLLPPGRNSLWCVWGHVQAFLCWIVTMFTVPLAVVLPIALDDGTPFVDYVPFAAPTLLALFFGVFTGIKWGVRAKRRVTDPGRASLLAHRADPANALSPAQQVALGGLAAVPDPGLRHQLLTAARVRPGRNRAHPGSPVPYVPVPYVPAVATVWCAAHAPGGGNPGAGCGGGPGGCSAGGGGGCSGSGGCSGGGNGNACSGGGSGGDGGGGGGGGCGGGSS